MIEKKTILDRYRGEFFDGEWPSIIEMLKLNAHRYSDRPAFSHFEGNEKHSITFSQLLERVYGVATFLKSKGIKKGDRIVLNGKNTPAWGISYLGIQALSAIVVPLDNQMAADRVDALSEFSGARAIFADSDVLDRSSGDFEFKVALSKYENEEYIDFESIKATKKAPGALPTEDEVAAILFTSGTTGNEKGVILTHANFMSNVFQASDPNFLNFTYEDVLYGLLPLHHSYSMTAVFLEAIKQGSELIFGQTLAVTKVLNEMRRGKISLFLAIPLLYNKFLAGLMKKVKEKGLLAYAMIRTLMVVNGFMRKVFKVNPGRKWFHQLLDGIGMLHNRICICGGGPLSPKTFQRYQQLGIDFIQGYGLTETAPILTLNPVSRFKVKSVGKVLPLIEMRIDDPDLLGVGEVQVKGPNVCQGYYNDPKNSAALFTEDGFLKTGDLGYLDKENYLYLKGRATNLIVTEGGKHVYPEEIEDFFQLYGEIDQVMIRGFMAKKSAKAEGIEALIYPNIEYYEGKSDDDIAKDIDKIVREVNKKLVAYKKIEKTTILEKPMEMTSTKKIQRNKVARTIGRLLGNG